jgi:xyloglucan-specific exo-beta-1,4-glucanase
MGHCVARPRRRIIAICLGLILVLLLALLGLAHQMTDRDRAEFSGVVIRGGGFVTGLVVQGGSMYARTDVGGAYRFDKDDQRWEQMLTASAVTSDRRSSDYQVEALGAAPSDPATVYMLVGATKEDSVGARLLRSYDAGRSWTVLPTEWYVGGNDEWRQSGARIAVDPSDSRVLFVGTRRNGLQLSRDGGVTWQSAMNPPAIDQNSDLYNIGVSSVAIDPESAVVEGRHSVVWVGVAGEGLMRSLDAGRSWTLVSSFSIGFVSDMALTPGGALVACLYGLGEDSRSYVKRVDVTGAVVDITPPAEGRWLTVASDPNRPDTLLVASDSLIKGTGIFTTRNGFAPHPDWVALPSTISKGADGTTWPTESDVFDYLSTGQIRFFNGAIWFAEGVGMWRTDSAFKDSLTWQFASDGIEEFVGNAVYKPADAPLLTAQWDRGLMRHPDPTNRKPSNGQEAGFPYTTHFGSAWDIGASPTDPDFLVAVLDDHQDLSGQTVPERRASGYSSDGGVTWNRFAALTNGIAPSDLLFGNIAVSARDNSNLVWVPSNLTGLETKVYYSRDEGATWSSGQMRGLEAGQYLHDRYTQARKILVADPDTPGLFYALGSDTTGAAVVWKSADGGATWNVTWESGPADVGSNGFKFDSTLVATGGYLIATPGTDGGCFYRSREGGQWEKMCTLEGALGMGVGAPIEGGKPIAGGNGNVALYTYGTLDGSTGIYRSTDYGTHWQRQSGQPGGLFMGIRAIAGDPQISGRIYVALNGGGFLVGQF